MQQSFIEQQDSNEVQSSKYTSNITNLNKIIKKYEEKNQYLKDKYETHLKNLGDKYQESIDDNTKNIEEIQDITNSYSQKQIAISTKYKKTLMIINKNLENLKRTYNKLKNDKANCDEDVQFFKNMINKMTGQTAELEEKAAKKKKKQKLAEQQAAAAAASAASSAELAQQQAAAQAAAAAEAKRRKEERERMKQQLLDAQKLGEEAGKVAKSNAEVVSCKQEIDDINSQINILNDSSADSIAKITKIYESLIQEQKINSKYESVYNIPLEKTKEI